MCILIIHITHINRRNENILVIYNACRRMCDVMGVNALTVRLELTVNVIKKAQNVLLILELGREANIHFMFVLHITDSEKIKHVTFVWKEQKPIEIATSGFEVTEFVMQHYHVGNCTTEYSTGKQRGSMRMYYTMNAYTLILIHTF